MSKNSSFNPLRLFRSVLPDLLGFAGLALLGTGLWMYRPWVSLAVVGAIMVLLAVAVGRMGAPPAPGGEPRP